MAELAGTLTDALLQRIRDQQGLGITPVVDNNGVAQNPSTLAGRAFARTLLSHAQMLINGAQEQVLQTFTLTTAPFQCVYNINGLIQANNQWAGGNKADDCVRIIGVRDVQRDLNRVAFRTLAHIDRHWFRKLANQFTTWSMLGADTLVLYPGCQTRVALTVYYVRRCDFLTDDTVATAIDDDTLPEVVDIAQALYHLKHRDMALLPQILQRLGDRYAKNLPKKERG